MDPHPQNDREDRSAASRSEAAPDNPLSPVIRRLVESRAAHLYADRPIGDFWLPSDPRSPFEEALTIRQLCSLNLDPFIQKRSFTETKLRALIKAIEECIASGERSDALRVPEKNANAVSLRDSQWSMSDRKRVWTLAEGVHPLVASTISSLLCSADGEGPILCRIVYRVIQAVPVKGLEVLACCQYLTEIEAAKILGRDESEITAIRDSAIKTAVDILRDDPILALPLLLMRGAVVVSPNLLVSQLRDPSPLEPGAARFAVSMLCHAADLIPVATGALGGKGLMTTSKDRLEEFLEALRSRLPRSRQELKSSLEELVPLVSDEHREAMLLAVGTFDQTTEIWFPVGEEIVKDQRLVSRAAPSPRRRRKV